MSDSPAAPAVDDSTMSPKQRLLAALTCQAVDRTPWVPFVGCHAGALLDVSATEYLRSADHIFNGIAEARKRYAPDGLPITFDLQIEAETLGCELNWAEQNPPAVVGHPLASGVALADLNVPGPDAGRIPLVVEATRRAAEAFGDEIGLYGLITGPFTLALHLQGTEIFMHMFDEPERVKELMAFARDVAVAMADYYLDAGADIVAVVDPMTSQIGPDQFTEFVTPYVAPVFEHIRGRGKLGSFFVCGHAQQNVAVMCECRPDNVSVDENIPLEFVRDICLPRGVSFGGNLQLTSVLLLGGPADAQRNALACMDTAGEMGFVLAPGCDLPYATPPENLEAVAQLVTDPYQKDVARNLASEDTDLAQLDMREYGQQDKVIVDIVTLDSEACAPCQYMVGAVKAVAPEFEGIVEWREHKIKYRESLVFMTSLMVRNVPTICIDGQITFVSRIPPRDELIAAIQRRINEKFRIKIHSHRASLYVMGDGGETCQLTVENIKTAITELGADVHVELITDENRMQFYGVVAAQTPAVVMARYSLKAVHSVPEVPIIKEWLKDLR